MTSPISELTFETRLASYQDVVAVKRDGVKAEAILLEDYTITFVWRGARWRLRVPAGYTYAPSIPAFLRSFTPATGSAQWAAVPHDWGYQHATMPRWDLDHLYADIMSMLGERPRYRRRNYLGIRLGGWLPWMRHKHEDDAPTYVGMQFIEVTDEEEWMRWRHIDEACR